MIRKPKKKKTIEMVSARFEKAVSIACRVDVVIIFFFCFYSYFKNESALEHFNVDVFAQND